VSSIFPPLCTIVSWEQGVKLLMPGQVVFAVMAEAATNEPSRLCAASIGLAIPADPNHHGYISEHHTFGQRQQPAGDYAKTWPPACSPRCSAPVRPRAGVGSAA